MNFDYGEDFITKADTRDSIIWRVFGPIDVDDFLVCDFALFECGFQMILVFWGGPKGGKFHPGADFKTKAGWLSGQGVETWKWSMRTKRYVHNAFVNRWPRRRRLERAVSTYLYVYSEVGVFKNGLYEVFKESISYLLSISLSYLLCITYHLLSTVHKWS